MPPAKPDREDPGRSLLAGLICVFLLFQPVAVFANPLGEAIRHGDVQFERIDGQLRILQGTDKAIIDWESFSIAAGESTEFVQPGVTSAALNRVRGAAASQIDGALRANGRVFLLNPNGIVIGPTGTIDVAGFVASTLDLPDEEFLAGGDMNFRGTSQATVVNLGTISAFDGDVFLIAHTVENHGTISAPNGTVGLAAGTDVLIQAEGDERVFVRAGNGSVTNSSTGSIEAAVAELKAYSGNVYGMAVHNEGRIAATGVENRGGQIFLRANGGKIRSTGTLRARKSDGSGGRIEIDAGPGGEVEAGGVIDAAGDTGPGGEILILGSQITIEPGTLVIADGQTGGGSIFIGGGERGEDPALMNAQNVTVGQGAVLSADALSRGNGGTISVFAENMVDVQGTLSARGGPGGGEGGIINVLGSEIELGHLARLDASGFSGGGEVYVGGGLQGQDPDRMNAENVGVESGAILATDAISAGDGGTIVTFAENRLDFAGQASARGGPLGGDGGFIELSGRREIYVNNFVDQIKLGAPNGRAGTLLIDPVDVTAVHGTGGGITGTTITDGAINTTLGAMSVAISSSGLGAGNGDITLFGSGDPGGAVDINWITGNTLTFNAFRQFQMRGGATIDASGPGGLGTGSVVINGESAVGNLGAVTIGDPGGGVASPATAATIATGLGSITLNGNQSPIPMTGFFDGVLIQGGSMVTTGDGAINISGLGGGSGVGNRGLRMEDASAVRATGAGTVTINGNGAAGPAFRQHGVGLFDAGTSISTNNGQLMITGTGGGDGTMGEQEGVVLFSGTTVETTGTGNLLINGTGGNSSGRANGVWLLGQTRTTGTGNLSITGAPGTGTSFSGVFINSGVSVQSAGDLTIDSTHNVTLDNGSSVSVTNGQLMINANVAGTATGNFTGITLNNASIQTTGTGNISLTGFGGDDAGTGDHYGVLLENGASVSSTATGPSAGTISINGTGGEGTTGNFGVAMQSGATTKVTSVDGAISITGQAGNGTTDFNTGIFLQDIDTISSTGTGANAATITLDGTGGTGTEFNEGVRIFGATTDVTSVDGAISIIGQGGNGTGDFNDGILNANSATVTSTGTGAIMATGTGGGTGALTSKNRGIQMSSGVWSVNSGAMTIIGFGGGGGGGGNDNIGIQLAGGSQYTTVDGNVMLTGTGGATTGAGNKGVFITGGSQIRSTGTGVNAGLLTLQGDGANGGTSGLIGFEVNSGKVQSADGNISIIGNGGNGSGSFNDGILIFDDVIATGDAGITMMGTAGTGVDSNAGVEVVFAGALVQSFNGDISITGIANGTGFTDNDGVAINLNSAVRTTGTGNIGLNGTGTAIGSGQGVFIQGGGMAQATGSGNLMITGRGTGFLDAILISSPISANTGTVTTAVDDGAVNLGGSISLDAAVTAGGGLIMNGGGGGDTFNVASTFPATVNYNGGGGSDTLNFGDNPNAIMLNASSLNSIEMVTGSNQVDTFNGPAAATTYTVTGANAFSFNTTAVTSFENLNSGANADRFNFRTGGSFSGALNGGDNIDIIDYATENFTGPAAINFDAMNGSGFTGGGTFNNIETFIGRGDGFTFNGPAAATNYAMNGENDFTFGATTVTDFANLNAGANDDSFNFNPGSSLTGQLEAAGGNDTLNYANFGTGVVVNLGTGLATAIDGGFMNVENFVGTVGIDTLTGPTAASNFNMTGPNQFDVGGVFFINQFENLIGGPNGDSFIFQPGSSLSGFVNGGGGTNTLNYNGFGSTVTVDLSTASATGIGGGFQNVSNFIGSTGTSDSFTGPNTGGVFTFTAQDTFNIGGTITATSFENVTGGAGADTFMPVGAAGLTGQLNGGAGSDTLDYTASGGPIEVNIGSNTATGFAGVMGIENYIGSAAQDTLISNGAADVFNVVTDFGGDVNGTTTFASFEILNGGSDNDLFNFLNQATVSLVIGGPGTDTIFLNDSNLGGTNIYNITASSISRNPTYNFNTVEVLQLLLGPGDDTVNTQAFGGLIQILDGGPGTNILNAPGLLAGTGSPFGPISFVNFDQSASGGGGGADTGSILQLQLDQQFAGFSDPFAFTDGAGTFTNLFSGGSLNLSPESIAAIQGAFNAVTAGVGQAIVIGVGPDGIILAPISLDGSGLSPSNLVVQALADALAPGATLELADALGIPMALMLIGENGAYALDASGAPLNPVTLTNLLGNLSTTANTELLNALRLVVILPVSPVDGGVSIGSNDPPPGQAVLVILTGQLSPQAQAELNTALGIGAAGN